VVVVGHWWAVIPAAFALFQIAQSVSATRAAEALRMGTYRIPNPNNGAPDGNSAPL
jgi:ribosomal protein L16/L10AE